MSLPPHPAQIEARAQNVRVLMLDVDGVLTDGRLWFLADGIEAKAFHVRDGLGIQLMLASGCQVALISGRDSVATRARAEELGIQLLYLGISDKVAAFEDVLERLGLEPENAAYVGDDLPDLPMMARVGLSFAVADAAPEIRSAAHVVLRVNGGQGAVREACERILKARGAWNVT